MTDAELQATFDREFRGQIERFREPLVAALRKLITAPLPGGAFEVLSFEMQADWRCFPMYAFAMDREAVNEEYFEPPFKGKVLPESTGHLIPKGALDQDWYEEAGVATFESGSRVLARGRRGVVPATGVHQPARQFAVLRPAGASVGPSR